jgi:hypothetical protein
VIALRIAAWSAWAPGLADRDAWRGWAAAPRPPGDGAPPDTRFLPAMLRRRCDPLSRAMIEAVHGCCDEATRAEAVCVFASRHGAFSTMISLLEDLAIDAPLSPARFSHSVHNTQSGLFSIWAKNRQPAMSLAAAGDTFAHGMLDAAALLQRAPGRRALLVCGDEPIPASIAPASDHQYGLHALALLLDAADGVGDPLDFELQVCAGGATAPVPELPDPLAFLRWWLSGEPGLSLERPPRRWLFSRGATGGA